MTEILCNTGAYVGSVISIPIILGVIYWVTKTRVDNKTCDRTHSAVDIEHANLRTYIRDTEERAENRHKELVGLIKNGGKPQK